MGTAQRQHSSAQIALTRRQTIGLFLVLGVLAGSGITAANIHFTTATAQPADTNQTTSLAGAENETLPAPDPEHVNGRYQVGIQDGAVVQGSDDANVTIIAFIDYKCGFCRRYFQQTLPVLREERIETGDVRYVTHDFPLLDDVSFIAAEATHCVKRQSGVAGYRAMKRGLFNNQQIQNRRNIYTLAETLNGVNPDRFKTCMETNQTRGIVEQHRAYGFRLGVRGTPTFFIGTPSRGYEKIGGACPPATFRQAVTAEQQGTEWSVDQDCRFTQNSTA
jgi:protein-disulfide isomerase